MHHVSSGVVECHTDFKEERPQARESTCICLCQVSEFSLQAGKSKIVFYIPHLRGLASILAPVLLVGCGLQLWLWFDNMLSGWQVLTYGQPAALVAAYIQHKIRACMLVEASSQSATLPPSPTLEYASAVRDSGVTIDLEQKPCTPIGDRDCEDELVSVFEVMTPKGLFRNCEECFDDK